MPRESLTEYSTKDIGSNTQSELNSLFRHIKKHVGTNKETKDGGLVVKDKTIKFGLFTQFLIEQRGRFESVTVSMDDGSRPTENDTIILLPYAMGKDGYPQDVSGDVNERMVEEIHPLSNWSPNTPKNSGAFLIKVKGNL